MRLSVVMPYYNRRSLIKNVLASITPGDIEVIIVDDGSSMEHQIDDILDDYDFDIRLLKLAIKTAWRGPTIAYNVGFKEAQGDVIIINSSECIHVGNIIGYVTKNFRDNDYMAFSACMGEPGIEYDYSKDFLKKAQEKGAWWGVHSSIGNMIPYCAAISKKNMDILGGYDLRFVEGIGYDDYDFTHRVKNLKLNTMIVDNPFCFHQWHKPTEYPNTRNLDLLKYLNLTEPDRITAR